MRKRAAVLIGGIFLAAAPALAGNFPPEFERWNRLEEAAFNRHLKAATDAAQRSDRKQAQVALRGALLAANYDFSRGGGCGGWTFAPPLWTLSVQARIGDDAGARKTALGADDPCETATRLNRVAYAQHARHLPARLPDDAYRDEYKALARLFLPPRPDAARDTRAYVAVFADACTQQTLRNRRVPQVAYASPRPSLTPGSFVALAGVAGSAVGLMSFLRKRRRMQR